MPFRVRHESRISRADATLTASLCSHCYPDYRYRSCCSRRVGIVDHHGGLAAGQRNYYYYGMRISRVESAKEH